MLHTNINRALVTSADESSTVWQETNSALNVRITEITEAKHLLERHLQKLKCDIDVLKKRIEEIRKALDGKRPLLQV